MDDLRNLNQGDTKHGWQRVGSLDFGVLTWLSCQRAPRRGDEGQGREVALLMQLACPALGQSPSAWAHPSQGRVHSHV